MNNEPPVITSLFNNVEVIIFPFNVYIFLRRLFIAIGLVTNLSIQMLNPFEVFFFLSAKFCFAARWMQKFPYHIRL